MIEILNTRTSYQFKHRDYDAIDTKFASNNILEHIVKNGG